MNPFIDIAGASGSIYRFRRVSDLAALPATAGNFILARLAGDQEEVVCCGTAVSLSRAEIHLRAAIDRHCASAIFARLNVSKATRSSEHEDIVEGHGWLAALTEIDQA